MLVAVRAALVAGAFDVASGLFVDSSMWPRGAQPAYASFLRGLITHLHAAVQATQRAIEGVSGGTAITFARAAPAGPHACKLPPVAPTRPALVPAPAPTLPTQPADVPDRAWGSQPPDMSWLHPLIAQRRERLRWAGPLAKSALAWAAAAQVQSPAVGTDQAGVSSSSDDESTIGPRNNARPSTPALAEDIPGIAAVQAAAHDMLAGPLRPTLFGDFDAP